MCAYINEYIYKFTLCTRFLYVKLLGRSTWDILSTCGIMTLQMGFHVPVGPEKEPKRGGHPGPSCGKLLTKNTANFSGKYGNCADVSRLAELHQDLSIRQKPKSTSGQVVMQPVSPTLAGEWEDPAASPFSSGCLCC